MAGEPTRALVKRLLEWYRHNRRDLPWRGTTEPYHIVVAEFMLHQTRVATVLPYYHRFLQRFPSWAALANAPLDDVLKVWEGLGYYARARNLHALAQRVCFQFGGVLPSSREALLALPGIGTYTAGAILSIAFGQDQVAIDGNVRRVLCRAFQITEDPTSPEGQRHVWAVAESLLPQGQAGAFNQALMDLSSTICTPKKPVCPQCPLNKECLSRQLDIQESLPVRRPARPIPHYDVAAGVVWRDECILIAKRPSRGLLGGLWEFPGGKREPGESLEDCLRREIHEELDVEVEVGALLMTVEHAYTHFRITLHAYTCHYLGGEPKAIGCSEFKWVSPEQLADHAFPAANHAIIRLLTQLPTSADPVQGGQSERPQHHKSQERRFSDL